MTTEALRQTLDALVATSNEIVELMAAGEDTDVAIYELVSRLRLYGRLGVYQSTELGTGSSDFDEITEHLRAIAVLTDRALGSYPEVDEQAIGAAAGHMAFFIEFLRLVDERDEGTG
jgi:hypothetical protein